MDSNVHNLQEVVFGGKKGKSTQSVQTAKTALNRASVRLEDADYRLDLNAIPSLDQQMMTGEIALGESAHERDIDSNKNYGPALVPADNKNFDTMTNPGIKC